MAAAMVPPFRLTRTVVVAVVVLVLACVWFAGGLLHQPPTLVGWLPLLVAVPLAARASWRASGEGRNYWRYVSAGIVLIGLGAGSNAYDYLTGTQQGQH